VSRRCVHRSWMASSGAVKSGDMWLGWSHQILGLKNLEFLWLWLFYGSISLILQIPVPEFWFVRNCRIECVIPLFCCFWVLMMRKVDGPLNKLRVLLLQVELDGFWSVILFNITSTRSLQHEVPALRDSMRLLSSPSCNVCMVDKGSSYWCSVHRPRDFSSRVVWIVK